MNKKNQTKETDIDCNEIGFGIYILGSNFLENKPTYKLFIKDMNYKSSELRAENDDVLNWKFIPYKNFDKTDDLLKEFVDGNEFKINL